MTQPDKPVDKNDHVVIAFFASEAAANTAIDGLKAWDKANDHMKLGAIGTISKEGDKVKITLRFRGREMAHLELGMALLNKVREETAAIAKVEAEPRLEGRQREMVLAPK